MYVRLGNRPPSLVERAEALEALASLLRGGLMLREALLGWSENVPARAVPHARRVGRVVSLGAPLADAILSASDLLGDDVGALRAAIELHDEVGADPIPLIERSATLIRRRADSHASGRAAAAGAKLSGWMVGGLPLVSLPLLPMARAPLFDTPGLAVLFLGLVLTAGGMLWMIRLVPAGRPGDDPAASFADHVVAALDAGAPLPVSLEVGARHSADPLRAPLRRAIRRTRLGQSWPDALEATETEIFSPLVGALRRAERLGVPARGALEGFARARREAAERAFELELRRAPVWMVLPLVLCVLPAFGLLAIVPFLRGLAFA